MTDLRQSFGMAAPKPSSRPLLDQLLRPGPEPSTLLPLAQLPTTVQFLERKLLYSPQALQEVVAVDRSILHGTPVFRGTRLPLYVVIEEMSEGASLAEIAESYSSVSVPQLQAGLDFVSLLLRVSDDQVLDR